MTHAKRDAQALLDDMLPFARTMLAKYGEFYPYGGYMKTDGSIVHVGIANPSTDRPQATDLLETLVAGYRMRAEAGTIRATALVYDVRVVPPNQSDKSDAIQVTLEHLDSYCADVFLPYRIREDGELVFAEMFAQEGERSVFRSC